MFDPFGVLCCGDLILPRIVTMDIFLLLQFHFTMRQNNRLQKEVRVYRTSFLLYSGREIGIFPPSLSVETIKQRTAVLNSHRNKDNEQLPFSDTFASASLQCGIPFSKNISLASVLQ